MLAESVEKASSTLIPELGLGEVRLFGVRFHAVTRDEAVATLFKWFENAQPTCRVVVTPNVDHVVRVRANRAQQAAYDAADLIVADGWPLVAVSRLVRAPLPQRVAGSDLVPMVLKQWSGRHPLRVFLLGAAAGVAEVAASRIIADCPNVEICGTYSPPPGFELVPAENDLILERINPVSPDLVVVGFGAPKQEIWLHQHAKQLNARVAIAAGGTIDFLAGKQPRAPVWVRRIGMEWFHRLASDPKRLAGRYLYDAWIFPQLVLKECVERILAKIGPA